MNPNGDYIPVESQAPFRGLATSPISTRLGPGYSPNMLNCQIREDGVVRRRPGYTKLGRTLVGRVLAMEEFGALGEDPYFVVLTSHRQYYYDPVSQDFIDLTPGQQTYPITDVTATLFKVAGDKTLDFPVGRIFPVLGGANEGIYTVVTSTFGGGKTTINVAEAMLSLVVAGNIVVADDFTTAAEAQIDFEDVTDISGRRFIVTNNNDKPRFWDGNTSNAFAIWTPAFTDFLTCKTIKVFAEHLMLGGITTTTSVEPQTVAWSTAGDFEDFNTGDSGVQILYQLIDIVAMKILGDRLVIYSNDVIITSIFIDLPAVFAFEVVVPEGTRFIGKNALVSIDVGHIYLSEQSIYLFDGSRGLRVLGDMIATDYRSVKDQENLHLVASTNDFAKRMIFFAVPDVSGGTVLYSLFYDVYNLNATVWSRERFVHSPRSFGFFINRAETLTWEDASWETPSMPWEDETGSWGEEGEQLGFPIRTFGTNAGEVFLITESVLNDNGSEATQLYETMDFTIPEAFHSSIGRWGELEFEAEGSEMGVAFSLDKGGSFVSAAKVPNAEDTVALTASPTYYRIPVDFSSRTLRVKFESTVDFALRWIRLWVRPGGPR